MSEKKFYILFLSAIFMLIVFGFLASYYNDNKRYQYIKKYYPDLTFSEYIFLQKHLKILPENK